LSIWIPNLLFAQQECQDCDCILRYANAALKQNRFTAAIDLYTAVKLCDHRRTVEMDKKIRETNLTSEKARQKAIKASIVAEKLKKDAEKSRDDAEKSRDEAEIAKKTTELALKEAESQAEIARKARDTAHWQTELARRATKEAEIARDEAQKQRKIAEKQRRAAENYARFLFYEKDNPTLAQSIAWYNVLSYRNDDSLQGGAYRRLLDDSTGSFFCTLFEHTFFYSRISVSPDGSTVVASDAYDLQTWDLASGKKKYKLTGKCPIQSFKISFDNKYVLIHCPGTLQIRSLSSKKIIDTIDCGLNVTSATFSPDGKSLLIGYQDGLIELRDLESRKVTKSWVWERNNVKSVVFSPNGAFVVTGGDERTALWDLKTGQLVRTRVHKNTLTYFYDYPTPIFSPQGNLLMTVSENRKVKIASVVTGKSVMTISTHQKPIIAGSFSADEKWLLTADDETVKLWDVVQQKIVYSFSLPPTHHVKRLAFIQNKPYFFSKSTAGELRLWQADETQSNKKHKKCIYQYSMSELRSAGVLLEPEDEARANQEDAEKKQKE
jgi:WD40 repeat protein